MTRMDETQALAYVFHFCIGWRIMMKLETLSCEANMAESISLSGIQSQAISSFRVCGGRALPVPRHL